MKKISIQIFRTFLLVLTVLLLVSCKPEDPTVPTETPTTFTVTFNADNGTTPVTVEVEEGNTVQRPQDPTKEGYTFNDWFLGDDAYVFSTPVTANITLVAKYTEVVVETEYTVSFNSVGGTAVSSQIVDAGDQAIEPTQPEKAAFSFNGWLLNGVAYDFSAPVNSNIELYAKYSFLGIPDSPLYQGRVYNSDFDQLINAFTANTIDSEIVLNASIDSDQPYISVGYSGTIGNNPDGALWKQAGSANAATSAFQYLVIRLRGFAGASVEDLAIGFRLDDNREVLVIPFTDTFDPDLENNVRELDENWHNYVISITDTLDGKEFIGKTGHANVPASGEIVGFHLMNISGDGSGILELKDAYYSKVPNPIFPYEGSDYNQNKDYWSGTVGVQVGTYVTIQPDGHYGEFIDTDVNPDNTHLVLRLRQASPGLLDINDLSVAPIFENGTVGEATSFADIDGLPTALGSGWLNVTIPYEDIYDGSDIIAGYKLINEGATDVAISLAFLSYLGVYEAVEYPVLNLEQPLIYDNFSRPTIGTTSVWSGDNEVALNNGFTYLISYSGLFASSIGDGAITFDSTGGDFVSYTVTSVSKANMNEYRYLVFKYKLNDTGTLDNLRLQQIDSNDANGPTVYANQWQAGLGLPSIPEDMGSYPYVDGDWTYLIVDLTLTEGYTTDFSGFNLYYTGSSISFDAIFFANPISQLDTTSEFMWATFEGLELGTAQGKVSDQQYWANVYDSPTTIVADGDDNQALQLDGTGYAQYHTAAMGTGRYLAFDLKVTTPGTIVSFRVGPTGAPLWAKDGELILENGTPMVVNLDGQWHRYVIDWVASGLDLTDTIGFHASDGEIYLLDNIAWFNALPHYDGELLWGTWDGLAEGDANGQHGPSQYWASNYGTPSSFVEVEGNMMLKLDGSAGYVQYHTGVMGVPQFISFDIKVEAAGSFGLNVGGTHKWNDELIGLDGNPIVLPSVGSTARIVVDVALSGLPFADEFGIQANDGAILYIDNLAFQWLDDDHGMYPLLEEDFETTPVNDGSKYWWGEWALVTDGAIELVTDGYATLRFGSPLIAGSKFITFDVKLDAGNNADEFRLELGDGNIVYWDTLVTDGVVSDVSADFVTVTIDLSAYVTNLGGLQVIGFHMNEGGVIIDNLVLSQDVYGYQLSLFNDSPVE
ncbi:InlB B-repeat-containing protein [Peloplasma aerotolerans]|uniref:InlB B-repeat-containing protein n=1 Tax=Peloplasma aerotolerans TaxID=3044389 RepID=A0AAW6UAL3_9MOLU|nr:InlB B-repeat-containing protein [Mariniplasma sp. M4Ah]MDI6452551.1 InlB B-repeat-containing protein [Mariniplasma sp. M4Ah]